MKVTLVLEDEEDGSIKLSGDFEPPLDTTATISSPAQTFAMAVIESLDELGRSEVLSVNGEPLKEEEE